MRPRIALGFLTLCVGCEPVQGPNDVHHVEGEFCEPGKQDEAVLEAEAWRVTIFYNESQVRDVVEDGVHRFVEFRICASRVCMVDPGFASSSEEAIAACRSSTNLPSPLLWPWRADSSDGS
jgi:hypothetical protein